LKSEESSPE
jgi:hypothetical protein